MVLYAAIDFHKRLFQAAVLDLESGEVVEERVSADRGSLAQWTERWRGRVAAVAIVLTLCLRVGRAWLTRAARCYL